MECTNMKQLDEIIILSMGPSWFMCPQQAPEGSELWAINTMYRSDKKIDKLFIMHDIRRDILFQDKNFVDAVNASGLPVYTAGLYPSLTNNVEYPIEDVLKEFGTGFFLNTVSWMLPYAIMHKPKKIFLFGCDMRPDSGREHYTNEKGCIEFWCGVAVGRGIEVVIPEESYICKRVMTGNFYGYHPSPQTIQKKGLWQLIPDGKQKEYNRFKMIPIDKDGNQIGDIDTFDLDLEECRVNPFFRETQMKSNFGDGWG